MDLSLMKRKSGPRDRVPQLARSIHTAAARASAVIADCSVGPRAFAHAGRARTARRLSRSCAQSPSLAKPRS